MIYDIFKYKNLPTVKFQTFLERDIFVYITWRIVKIEQINFSVNYSEALTVSFKQRLTRSSRIRRARADKRGRPMTNVIDTWQLTHISRHYPYLSVDCSVNDARVLEATRKRDSCRRQPFAISHSSASSSYTVYEFIATLYHRHFHESSFMHFAQFAIPLLASLHSYINTLYIQLQFLYFIVHDSINELYNFYYRKIERVAPTCFNFPLVKKRYR